MTQKPSSAGVSPRAEDGRLIQSAALKCRRTQRMIPEDFENQLHDEGFTQTFVWQDRPGAFYPDRTHPAETAHVILEGEMTLTVNGRTQTFRAGERCDVPAGTVHSARTGPRGCRYLIGEK